MITSITYDLEESRRRAERALMHIGRLSAACAGIEELATVVLARAIAPGDPDAAVRVFSGEQWGVLDRFLSRALPPKEQWPQTGQLLRAIKLIEDYRNNLAHSQVIAALGITQDSSVIRLRSVKAGWKEVDDAEFTHWEIKADIVYWVVRGLAYAQDPDVKSSDLLSFALDACRGESDQAFEACYELFPRLPGSVGSEGE